MKIKKFYIAPSAEEFVLQQGLSLLINMSGELQDSVEEGDIDTFGPITYTP